MDGFVGKLWREVSKIPVGIQSWLERRLHLLLLKLKEQKQGKKKKKKRNEKVF
jgi:hypothetical protein